MARNFPAGVAHRIAIGPSDLVDLRATTALVSELKQRTQRIAHLEAAILSAKRTPDELLALTEKIEQTARAKLQDLRNALADQSDLREVFLTLFPDGLTFTADRSPDGARQVWRITGAANFGSLVEPSGPDCVATPTWRDAIGTGSVHIDVLVGEWQPPSSSEVRR